MRIISKTAIRDYYTRNPIGTHAEYDRIKDIKNI